MRRINFIFLFLFGVVLLLTAVSALLWYLRLYEGAIGNVIYMQLFDLDHEANIPTIFSVLLLFSCSVILFFIGLREYAARRIYAWYWYGLSLILLIFSIDEFIAVHERLTAPLRTALNLEGFLYYAWIIPGLLLLILFFILFRRVFLAVHPNIKLQFILAGVLYIVGAFGFEIMSGYFRTQLFLYKMIAGIEELFEMLGIIVFLRVLLIIYILHGDKQKVQGVK